MKSPNLLILSIVFTLALGACSIHKIDIQQGNVITQETLEQVTVGMEKSQVKRLLGSPMIEDPFHENRWDYVYRFVVGATGEVQTGHISLLFTDNQLKTINVHTQPPLEAEIKTPSLVR